MIITYLDNNEYEVVLDEELVAYNADTLTPYDVYKTIKNDFIVGSMIGRVRVVFNENQEELAIFFPLSSLSVSSKDEYTYHLVSIDELSKYNTIYKKYKKKHEL